MVLSMKNPWIFIRIQIPMGVFRVMIKHLLITSYYYHPIKSLNVTVKSHVYSKFSNSVSDMFYSDGESRNIYIQDLSIFSNLYIKKNFHLINISVDPIFASNNILIFR